jgi:3D (Asp-Asp-Asp) domain-containing protein
MQIPVSTYGACPSLRMTTPGRGMGRAHREGPVRHVRARLATFSDDRQRTTVTDGCQTCRFLHEAGSPCSNGVVRSAPVLGQAYKPRRLLSFAAIALAVLAAPAVSGAITSHSASSLRAHDTALAGKSRAAVLDLYSLDQKLAGTQSRLTTLETQALSLRAQRASLAHQLRLAKRSTKLAQAHVAARLRALYEQGNVEPLEIVFGAKTIDEAMTSLDSLSRMTNQGEDVVRELKSARLTLGSAAKKIAAREAALATATQQARATANALASARAERTAYIGSLARQRRLTQQQISNVVAQAAAARITSEQLTRAAAVDPTIPAVSPSGAAVPAVAPAFASTAPAAAPAAGRTLVVSATGYSLPGRTATGLPVGWGVVAVDPSLIPLGTHMTIPGYGEAVAADTGGAVTGATIDLWFASIAQANAWGRRTVTITLH